MFTTFFDFGEPKGVPNCFDCSNCITRTQKMDTFFGKGRKGILLVFDRPTELEDKQGNPYSSARVMEVAEQLGKHGVDVYEDCFITYAIACWSPQNDGKSAKRKEFAKYYPLTPYNKQMLNCQIGIQGRVEDERVKIIVPLGKNALNAILYDRIAGRISSVPRKDYYGECIPDQVLNKWVCPTYCAEEIQQNSRDYAEVARQQRDAHLAWVATNYTTPTPRYPTTFTSSDEYTFKFTLEHNEAIELMQDAMNWKFLSFDYEATALKAQPDTSQLVCVGISNGTTTYSFPFYQTPEFLDMFEILMIDPSPKIAHNAQFEHVWTRIKGGRNTYINSWHWDTMLAAHLLNNVKSTQLKFQTYINLGVIGYDDSVDKFLKSDDKGGNSKNKIHYANINEVIQYCGLDAFYTAQLYLKQRSDPLFKSTPHLKAMEFMVEGTIALGDCHCEGFRVNEELLRSVLEHLPPQIEAEKVAIQKEYPEWNGKTSGKVFGDFIYNTLKCTPKIYTKDDDGNDTKVFCTDKAALSKLSHPFIDKIIPLIRKETPLTAFIIPIAREMCKSRIHPFFSLNSARTFRSSSRNPNFQNIPKRDKEQKEMLRSLLYPAKGMKLVEYDYKAVEVAVAACVYKDPMLIKYVVDPTTDMHRDVAVDIFFKTNETFTKAERQIAKNGYVFPSFYGSSGFNCGENLWETLQSEPKILSHMIKHNIDTKEKMQEHMRKYDDVFWNQRFSIYTQNKKELYAKYLRDGYVDTINGFRCYGPMGWTQAINVPVQGPASHIKLWTLVEVNKQLMKRKMRSRIICEIHDAIIAQVHPDEEQEYHEIIIEYGTKKVREHWDWIIVPLVLEREAAGVDEAWVMMK